MSDEMEWALAERTEAEERLAAARAGDDTYAEVRALVDLVAVSRRLGDPWALIGYAGRAWELADQHCYWDQLARLAVFFGDVALSGQEYQACCDHYANACAYAAMASTKQLQAVIARIDEVVAEMLATGRAGPAVTFCDLLVAYEAEGGLGRADPAFAAHFRERRSQAEAQLRAELAVTGGRLN